jgi:LytTr DNA-binding domain
MSAFFRQLYPFESRVWANLTKQLLIGTFVALFLIVFLPFQTEKWNNPARTILLAGYGLVTFLALFFIDGVLYLWSSGYRRLEIVWTVWMEILYSLAVILLITLGNTGYSYLIHISTFSVQAYWSWLNVVLMVGFFPIVGLVLWRYNYFKILNQKTATQMAAAVQDFRLMPTEDENSDEIVLIGENDKNRLALQSDDLWYIESADNYVIVLHREANRLRKTMLRGALRRFEEQLAATAQVVRCHRSYLVNLQKVNNVTGNAQGYRLLLTDFDVEVPVSRQYGPAVLTQLQRILVKRP